MLCGYGIFLCDCEIKTINDTGWLIKYMSLIYPPLKKLVGVTLDHVNFYQAISPIVTNQFMTTIKPIALSKILATEHVSFGLAVLILVGYWSTNNFVFV